MLGTGGYAAVLISDHIDHLEPYKVNCCVEACVERPRERDVSIDLHHAQILECRRSQRDRPVHKDVGILGNGKECRLDVLNLALIKRCVLHGSGFLLLGNQRSTRGSFSWRISARAGAGLAGGCI